MTWSRRASLPPIFFGEICRFDWRWPRTRAVKPPAGADDRDRVPARQRLLSVRSRALPCDDGTSVPGQVLPLNAGLVSVRFSPGSRRQQGAAILRLRARSRSSGTRAKARPAGGSARPRATACARRSPTPAAAAAHAWSGACGVSRRRARCSTTKPRKAARPHLPSPTRPSQARPRLSGDPAPLSWRRSGNTAVISRDVTANVMPRPTSARGPFAPRRGT